MNKKSMIKARNVVVTIGIPAIIFLILAIAQSDKVDISSLGNMMVQAIVPAILAWGVCFDIKVGNWDFSVGATVLIASILGGNIAKLLNLGIGGVIVCCILVGLGSSVLIGTIFRALKIPTIIVTIGMMLIIESVCGMIFDGAGVMLPQNWVVLGNPLFKVVIGIIVFFVAYYLYNFRKLGYQVRAVGNGPSVARLNGIDVYKVKFLCIVVAGFFAGCYAFMNIGATGVAKTVSSMGTMGTVFDAMMCVFVGMALANFTNLIVGVYVGSVIMQIIKLLLMLSGFPSMYNQVVIAVFVLVFMAVSSRSDVWKKLFGKKRQEAAALESRQT